MFTTPDEARKKLCPTSMPRTERECPTYCCADGCMAWRWQSALTVNNPSQRPGAAIQKVERNAGFCGLGGRP